MRQIIKRFALCLCVIAGLFSLTSYAAGTETAMDTPQMKLAYCQYFEQVVSAFSSYSDADLDAFIESARAGKAGEGSEAFVEAAESLKSIRADLGEFQSVDSSEIRDGGSGEYVCVVNVKYEKKNVTFEASFAPDATGPRISSMTFTPQSGLGSLSGGSVSPVLIAVIAAVAVLAVVAVRASGKSGDGTPAAPAAVAAAPRTEAADDDEIAAVIAAAIAASEEDEITAVIAAAVEAYEADITQSADPLRARSFRHARRTKRRW